MTPRTLQSLVSFHPCVPTARFGSIFALSIAFGGVFSIMPRHFGLHALIPALLALHPAAAATLPVDASGCLHLVKTGPSGTCDPKSKSMKIEMENTCKAPVRAQICLRGADKLWVDCATKDLLAPKEQFFAASCNATGDYTYWGCSKVTGPGACGGENLVGKATNVQP